MPLLRSESLSWIGLFVMYQLYAISILAVGTLFLLRWRTWKKDRIELYKSEYGGEIAEAVAGAEEKLSLQKPHRFARFRQEALREALLENISSITGVEREMLVTAYVELGCAREDQRDCSSVRWWRRLQALSNLSILQRGDMAGLYAFMRNDQSPLVSAAALLGLSQLNDARNNPADVLRELPEAFVTNGNLLLELCSNWAVLYGHEWLGDYLRVSPETKVARSLITVLISLRTSEATDILLQILESGSQTDERLVMKMRRAVMETGDSVVIDKMDVQGKVAYQSIPYRGVA